MPYSLRTGQPVGEQVAKRYQPGPTSGRDRPNISAAQANANRLNPSQVTATTRGLSYRLAVLAYLARRLAVLPIVAQAAKLNNARRLKWEEAMGRNIAFTSEAPATPPTYNQSVKAGGLVFVSGIGPFDVGTGKVRGETIQEQTRQCDDHLARRGGLCRLERRVGEVVSGKSAGAPRSQATRPHCEPEGVNCRYRRGLTAAAITRGASC